MFNIIRENKAKCLKFVVYFKQFTVLHSSSHVISCSVTNGKYLPIYWPVFVILTTKRSLSFVSFTSIFSWRTPCQWCRLVFSVWTGPACVLWRCLMNLNNKVRISTFVNNLIITDSRKSEGLRKVHKYFCNVGVSDVLQ